MFGGESTFYSLFSKKCPVLSDCSMDGFSGFVNYFMFLTNTSRNKLFDLLQRKILFSLDFCPA